MPCPTPNQWIYTNPTCHPFYCYRGTAQLWLCTQNVDISSWFPCLKFKMFFTPFTVLLKCLYTECDWLVLLLWIHMGLETFTNYKDSHEIMKIFIRFMLQQTFHHVHQQCHLHPGRCCGDASIFVPVNCLHHHRLSGLTSTSFPSRHVWLSHSTHWGGGAL